MELNKEINALLNLLDDPDEYVYQTVSEKILTFGLPIIPNLENLWENLEDHNAQERIESLIHRLHFRDLSTDVAQWANDPSDLLQGAILLDRFSYPELDVKANLQQFEKIRKNIWLELNNYLTAVEQVNVMNSIIYSYYKHRGLELDYEKPDDFLLHKTLELKKGNALANGVLYLALSQKLDIDIHVLKIPNQFILAYFDTSHQLSGSKYNPASRIKFFIDGLSGQIYSHKDLENYFKRMSITVQPSFYKPMANKEILQFLISEYSKCFSGNDRTEKYQELSYLLDILDK